MFYDTSKISLVELAPLSISNYYITLNNIWEKNTNIFNVNGNVISPPIQCRWLLPVYLSTSLLWVHSISSSLCDNDLIIYNFHSRVQAVRVPTAW